MFTPVKTKRAYDAVYEQIEDMILTGELKPGDKLPSERDLMTIYKRSHPTIREALRMLEASSYIRVIPGGCAIVSYSNTESMEDSVTELLQFRQVSFEAIYNFIKLSEVEFIPHTVQNFTWEDLIALETILNEMSKCKTCIVDYSEKLFEYHLGLMKATHNPLIYVFWSGMKPFWTIDSLEKHKTAISIKDITALQTIHETLVNAIRDKNEIMAANLVKESWENWQLISEISGKVENA